MKIFSIWYNNIEIVSTFFKGFIYLLTLCVYLERGRELIAAQVVETSC